MESYPRLMGRVTAHKLGLVSGGYNERGYLVDENTWIPEKEYEEELAHKVSGSAEVDLLSL